MTTKPYYEHGGIRLYLGDSRELLGELPDGAADTILTDPVWPGAGIGLTGSEDAVGLFASVAWQFPRLARRAVVQLGCDTDPRLLAAVPQEMPFIRLCSMEYAIPNYKGRILNTGDIAYVFGEMPRTADWYKVLPGRAVMVQPGQRPTWHPSPRQLFHVQWLVKWYARGLVLDPFAGSGTTLAAAAMAGLPAIGIEIEEQYCELAARRLEEVMAPEALQPFQFLEPAR